MVTHVDPMPVPAPSRTMSQLEFDQANAARIAAEPTYTAQFNAAVAETNANAISAEEDAAAAAISQAAALASENAAAASATTAVNAPGTAATSTSSMTLGTGSKSLTLAQTGKGFGVNQFVELVNSTGTWMLGNITAFNSSTGAMTVDATHFGGSGTFNAWTITPSVPSQIPSPAGNADKALYSYGGGYEYRTVLDPLTAITAPATIGEGDFVFAADVAVTLPDLSTPKKLSLTLPSNLSTFNSAVTTSDGWTVNMGFSAGVTKTNVPMVFSTPHGWWGSLAMTPPITSTSTAFGVSGTPTILASVALSATCHVYALQQGTDIFFATCDPTTGIWGSAIGAGPTGATTNGFLYAVSSTTFLWIPDTASNAAVVGTVSGTTITSMGTQQVLSSGLYDAPIQLTPTTYLLSYQGFTNNLQVLSVSGTTISLGTAVTANTAGNFQQISPISSTLALVLYASGSSTTAQLIARTVSISGTALTLNSTTTAATAAINGNGQYTAVVAMTASSFIVSCAGQGGGNDGAWYGLTVSGTAVTIGTVSNQTLLRLGGYWRQTFIYRHGGPISSTSWLYALQLDSSRLLVKNYMGSGSLHAVSISGTTLTFGAAFTTGTPAAIYTDIATGTNIYSKGTTSYSKLSISGTTITESYTVAAVVAIIFSDTLTDKVVSYSGVWYTWVGGPPALFPISVSKSAGWNAALTQLRAYGNIY